MSVVQALRKELGRWRQQWQHIETFLDRIDEMREQDEEHAKRTRLLIKVAAAFEHERALRDGSGLSQPLELAVPHPNFSAELAFEDGGDAPNPKANSRLPGAVDLEVAVAIMRIAIDEHGHLEPVKSVRLHPSIHPFQRFDEEKEVLIDVAIPGYDFAATEAIDVNIENLDSGLFSMTARQISAIGDKATGIPIISAPSPWTVVRNLRASYMVKGESAKDKLVALRTALMTPGYGSSSDEKDKKEKPSIEVLRKSALDALRDLETACRKGGATVLDVADALSGEYIPKPFSATKLGGAGARMSARGVVVGTVAKALESGAQAGPAALQSIDVAMASLFVDVDTGIYSRTGEGGSGLVEQALDDAVDARIASPDGTLRVLRITEWALHQRWESEKQWFDTRLHRYLQPLMVDRFLETFLASLTRLVHGHSTNAPLESGMTLDGNRPASLGSTYLQLERKPGGGHYDLKKIEPGHVTVIEGGRRTLAVMLGDDSTVGKRTDASASPELLQRIRITPLRVSLARSRQRVGAAAQAGVTPDMPGMLTSGKITAAHVSLTRDDLLGGAVRDRPQDEGIVEELISLWSRLCLLLGTDRVRARLAQNPPTSGLTEVPSFLPQSVLVPLGRLPSRSKADPVIQAHDRRLIVHISTLAHLGLDPDGPTKPVVGRPGELLLVRGTDDKGASWQGVVEVVSIVRTTLDHAEDDSLVPPLSTKVCCNDPGNVIVLQVLDTNFPVPLVSASIHRDFEGFGPPSLATGVLLPKVIDDVTGGDTRTHRGPELRDACAVLSRWMWPPN